MQAWLTLTLIGAAVAVVLGVGLAIVCSLFD